MYHQRSARIYQPAPNAMQSGTANTHRWVLEFDIASPRYIDDLMGWTGSTDMDQEVKLTFDTLDEAVSYASKHGIKYRIRQPHKPRSKPKAYADNFSSDRIRAFQMPRKIG